MNPTFRWLFCVCVNTGPYFLALLALSVGFAIGVAWIYRMHTKLMWYESSRITSAVANLAVANLRSIRSGETNKAIARLERQLDSAVMDLADISRENPFPEKETAPLKSLIRARDYRAEFPHTNIFPSVDRAIARAFAMTSKTNKP